MTKPPLESLGDVVYCVGEALAPSHWLVDRQPEDKQSRWAEGYILVWTVVLLAMWLVNPTVDAPLSYIFAGFAIWRWLEVFITGMGLAVGKKAFRAAETLIAAGIYALQITLVFAILDHSFAATGFSEVGHTRDAVDYLYVSWTGMTTIGSSATSDAARALTMATVTSGILLLGVLVSRAVARAADTTHQAVHDEIAKKLKQLSV